MAKPRANKTKEELVNDAKRKQQRAFLIEKFYPALKDATVSVEEATMLLSAIATLIMEEAMRTLQEKKVEEIRNRLIDKLEPGDRLLKIEALINLFAEETLFEARGHIEGMKSVIEQMKIETFQKKTLDELHPNWERYLN